MAIEITSQSLAGGEPEKTAAYKPSLPLSGFAATDKSVSRSRFGHRTSRWTRRNFSSRASHLSGGAAIIVSIPKSGLQPEIPRLIFSHDLFEHRTKGNLWDRLRGKYLVPRKELTRAKIVLLARDPRDCFVSLYLQITRRDPNAPVELRQKTVSEMLRDRRFGIGAIVSTMNDWIGEFSERRNFTLIRYEALRAAPAEHFRDLLAILGESTPDMTIFEEALDFSRFENMQKLEAAGAFDSKILHPGDVRDPESFKVRRGKVGGYREYLSEEEQAFAASALAKLDPGFGY